MLIGTLVWVTPALIKESLDEVSKIIIVIGFFIFGCSGLSIVYSKKFYYLFFELKGFLAVVYGLFLLLIGWMGSITFLVTYFGR
jgi:hypothetical protein